MTVAPTLAQPARLAGQCGPSTGMSRPVAAPAEAKMIVDDSRDETCFRTWLPIGMQTEFLTLAVIKRMM
jgi:hypothetical protein